MMPDRTHSWIVGDDAAGTRLDRFIAAQLPGESRSQIQNWIRGGGVGVGGDAVKTGRRLKAGDVVTLDAPVAPPPEPFPEAIPLEVLYEDGDVAVIDKPAGMACHAGAGLRAGTLVNALLHRMGPLEAGDPSRPGIVHRLDKFTSGVILTAKSNFAHRLLSAQFKGREVKKEYVALVHGAPSPPSGTIDLGIGRDPANRKKMSVRARRKRDAVTHYSVRLDFGFAALLDIGIDTGRTHQIRVHLAAKGHPVVGDPLYGGRGAKNLPAGVAPLAEALHRPFLHASRIEFTHPRSGERLAFSAPLPEELRRFLDRLAQKG
ncbi:MAG: RluA family pseudouridine synthase [Acidobacteriota bacterium]|jgi:23S rRNA pseudouridine1911/1915/1917 synthase|nr:RluA family pseudouridine synthase [Acidobacteriota bacterium]